LYSSVELGVLAVITPTAGIVVLHVPPRMSS
jgi:hypothetical protein